MELSKGTSLQNGKYTIDRKLGNGSFGITYLATMRVRVEGSLGSIYTTAPVAIKEFFMSELNSRSSDSSVVHGTQNTLVTNYRRKFRTEAQNLGQMSHSNIVNVLEVWDENNTTYYSMEYVDGLCLDDYIRQQGCLPENRAIEMFSQLARAVQYMHSKQMLHLDIKPKNVMLNKEGKLLLIDFGLSKHYDSNGEPESSTKVGGGTPGYAPVEQAEYHSGMGFPVTMDIYALGGTLFKMLTGQTPPTASMMVNDGFPSATLERCRISAATIAVVRKAMSPSKRDRYQSVDEMLAALNMEYDTPRYQYARSNETKNKTKKGNTRTRVSEKKTDKYNAETRIYDKSTIKDTSQDEREERILRRTVRQLVDKKDYRKAYQTCNQYLQEGRCTAVAQELLEWVENKMPKKGENTSIARTVISLICFIAALIILIITHF